MGTFLSLMINFLNLFAAIYLSFVLIVAILDAIIYRKDINLNIKGFFTALLWASWITFC
jgi:hypothetical protein